MEQLTTWLFGNATAELRDVHGSLAIVFASLGILGALTCWLIVAILKLRKCLKREEEFLHRAVTAMERAGLVPDSVEVESVEAS